MGGVRWKAANAIGSDDHVVTRLCVSAAASVGIGVFVIVGYVAKHVAGPATIISITIAAIVGLISALCNIELSQRLPRKASPYTFSHVSLGRFASFLTGWSLILEYAVALAVVAKAIGLYIDTLAGDAMQMAFASVAPLLGGYLLGTYFDFFAFAVVLLVGAVFLMDLHRRKWVDTGALVVGISVVIFIITAGSFNANPVNWSPNSAIDVDPGHLTPLPRGFFPFGVMDTFRGAALCTFAFIGIEMLMRSKRDTQRSVSYIGLLSFTMIFLSLLGCSIVLTLMLPHYQMHVNIPIPHAFAAYDFNLAKWIVSIAAIVILSTSLWTLMFPLKKQIRTLAEDALLPFDERNRRAFIVNQIIVVSISSMCAGMFSFGQLIDVLSVGTLLMFVVVSLSIVLLRFSHQLEIGSISTIDVAEMRRINFGMRSTISNDVTGNSTAHRNVRVWLNQIIGYDISDRSNQSNERRPTSRSYMVVKCAISVQLVSMICTAMTVRFAEEQIYAIESWAVVLLVLFVSIALLAITITALQPQRINRNYFQMPFVAVTAGLTLFACLLLAGMLDYTAWARFLLWMCVGVPVFIWSRWRRRLDEPAWPVRFGGGISKIQGLHNAGYVGEPVVNDRMEMRLPAALSDQMAEQMIEIAELDETEQLDVYAITETAVAPVDANDANNNADTLTKAVGRNKAPSPSSSFDGIIHETDIIESSSEHKETNGKAYFVSESATAAEISSISTCATNGDFPITAINVDEKNAVSITNTSTVAVLVHSERYNDEPDDSGKMYKNAGGIDVPSVIHDRNEVDKTKIFPSNIDDDATQINRSATMIIPTGPIADLHQLSENGQVEITPCEYAIETLPISIDLKCESEIAAIPVFDVAEPEAKSTSSFISIPTGMQPKSAVTATSPTSTTANDFKERLSLLLLGQTRTMLVRQTSTVSRNEDDIATTIAHSRNDDDTDPSAGDNRVGSSKDIARFTVTEVLPQMQPVESARQNEGNPNPLLLDVDLYNNTYIPPPDYDEEDEGDSEQPHTANDMKVTIRAKLEDIFSRGPPQRVSSLNRADNPLVDRHSPTGFIVQPNNISEINHKNYDNTVKYSPALVPRVIPTSDSITRSESHHRTAFRNVLEAIDMKQNQDSTGDVEKPRRRINHAATIEDARNSLRHVDGDLHLND